jgi:hypothetical protein
MVVGCLKNSLMLSVNRHSGKCSGVHCNLYNNKE